MKWLIRLLTNNLGVNNIVKTKNYYYDDIFIKCFYSEMIDNISIQNYLYSKLIDVIQNEYKIKVFELAKFDNDVSDACGLYVYLTNMTIEQQHEKTADNYNRIDRILKIDTLCYYDIRKYITSYNLMKNNEIL